MPSRNGAAVLFVHGWGASHDQLWPEASEAIAAGYGALLVDMPILRRDWAENAKRSVSAGLDFLSAQPGVRRLGAVGFSSGCAVLVQVAVGDPRVEALVLLAPYTTAHEHLDYEYRQWGSIAQLPAQAGARHAGYRVEELDSRAAVGKLAGRPLLVVAGDADVIVPLSMSLSLFAAAGEPKRFWLVTGAGHGDYAKVLGGAFAAGLREFFDANLRSTAGASAR